MKHLDYLNLFLITNSVPTSNCTISGHNDSVRGPLFINTYLSPELEWRNSFQCRQGCTTCLFDKPNQEVLRELADRLGRLEP